MSFRKKTRTKIYPCGAVLLGNYQKTTFVVYQLKEDSRSSHQENPSFVFRLFIVSSGISNRNLRLSKSQSGSNVRKQFKKPISLGEWVWSSAFEKVGLQNGASGRHVQEFSLTDEAEIFSKGSSFEFQSAGFWKPLVPAATQLPLNLSSTIDPTFKHDWLLRSPERIRGLRDASGASSRIRVFHVELNERSFASIFYMWSSLRAADVSFAWDECVVGLASGTTVDATCSCSADYAQALKKEKVTKFVHDEV